MKATIPVHHHDELSDNGVSLKIVTSKDVGRHPVEYAHRDDFYIFGIVVRGSLCYDLDFKQQIVRQGELQFILPGQVHRFISGEDFEGWMIMVENSMVDDACRHIFDKAAIHGMSVKADDQVLENLKSLHTLIRAQLSRGAGHMVVKHLVSAFVGMFASEFQQGSECDIHCSGRHVDIVLRLRALLEEDLHRSHSPSYYAGKLSISTVYLNEVVNKVTGVNAGTYIRNEIVLRSRRLLYHTNKSVKEIAAMLGFEDNAYFTRLFTKATGMSPLKFRQKH